MFGLYLTCYNFKNNEDTINILFSFEVYALQVRCNFLNSQVSFTGNPLLIAPIQIYIHIYMMKVLTDLHCKLEGGDNLVHDA